MQINVDIDGVLRDFDGKLREVFTRNFPELVVPPTTDHWELRKTYPHPQINSFAFNVWAREIYTLANPVPGAIEEFKLLREAGHKMSLVTSQPNPALKWLTMDWLTRFDLADDRQDIIFTKDKSNYECDIFVEDSPDHLRALDFDRTARVQLLRMARPWNVGAPGLAVKSMMEVRHFVERVTWNTRQK